MSQMHSSRDSVYIFKYTDDIFPIRLSNFKTFLKEIIPETFL